MQILDFSRNFLVGQILKEIGNLVHLRQLNLSRNFVEGHIPF